MIKEIVNLCTLIFFLMCSSVAFVLFMLLALLGVGPMAKEIWEEVSSEPEPEEEIEIIEEDKK